MARIYTESIYWSDGDVLHRRLGTVRLENQSDITTATRFTDRLQAQRGLLHTDVAVFFGVALSKQDLRHGTFDPLSLSFGYLVGEPGEEAGKGTLVRGDSCDIWPEKFVTPHMAETWSVLMQQAYTPAEFSLYGLTAYLQKTLYQAS